MRERVEIIFKACPLRLCPHQNPWSEYAVAQYDTEINLKYEYPLPESIMNTNNTNYL
jgi:hypothetical protein